MSKEQKIQVFNCDSLQVLLERYATEFPVGDKTYYELPFWFEKEGTGLKMFLRPPEDLQEFIIRANLGNPNSQPIKKEI